MATISEAWTVAVQHLQAGRLQAAEYVCRQILALEPNHAEAWHLLGIVGGQAGNHQRAAECFSRSLAVRPDWAEAHVNLGNALRQLGKLDEAVPMLRRALQLQTGSAEAHNNLGNALGDQGKLDEAIACYRRALELRPGYANAHYNLANALSQQGKLDEAVACYRRALELQPDFTEAHNNLGNALKDQGRPDEAAACYRLALRLAPDRADLHRNLGHAYRDLGHFDEANREYAAALRLDPGDVKTYYSLSLIHRFTPADPSTLEAIEAAAARDDLPLFERRQLHFALGKAYDDLGQYDRAFSHFHEANELARPDFDRSQFVRLVERMEAWFPRSRFAAGGDSGNPSQLPIFIVGMPRSGTTLVEQIIASHPQVYGCGEVVETETMANDLWGDRLAEPVVPPPPPGLEPQRLAQMAAAYLQRRQAVSGNVLRITSKMPTNFLYLGLIALLFPKARVIHCRRDPRDTCLSCYFTDFKKSPPYHHRLEDLGFYYRYYERMMNHWRAVLPLPMLEVQYEELVDRTEELSRQMIDFCGLAWDDRCLRYYENRRPVQTSSVWQVRQPIYTTSINRWKHYVQHLQPLLDALAAETG
jgi:tetratricopeptide (TPR) repeat protein